MNQICTKVTILSDIGAALKSYLVKFVLDKFEKCYIMYY